MKGQHPPVLLTRRPADNALEIRTHYPEAIDKLEIYVYGGFRVGADVLKALCLAATAVGVGRPYYYAMAAYELEGAGKCTDSKYTLRSQTFDKILY